MCNAIRTKFKLNALKMYIPAKLRSEKSKVFLPYYAVVDTGASDTAMSVHLFKMLGYKEQGKLKTTITGINGKSEGFSTIIDNLVIGGVDLGKTRVTVSEISPEFKNTVVLGMNVLVWFNMLISHSKGEIILSERQIKGLDTFDRFYRADIFSRNVLASIVEHEVHNED